MNKPATVKNSCNASQASASLHRMIGWQRTHSFIFLPVENAGLTGPLRWPESFPMTWKAAATAKVQQRICSWPTNTRTGPAFMWPPPRHEGPNHSEHFQNPREIVLGGQLANPKGNSATNERPELRRSSKKYRTSESPAPCQGSMRFLAEKTCKKPSPRKRAARTVASIRAALLFRA